MELLDIASLLVVGALISAVGTKFTDAALGPKPWAGRRGWRGVFYTTLWAHPIVVGAALGLAPGMPAPSFMGDAVIGRVIWYALAGVFSSSAYDAVAAVIKQRRARGDDDGATQ